VPVRLSAGARSYRTVLLGFPADAELRRIVGEAMVPQPLPAGGALLTRELAARLGVRPGDVIRVEPLEGARRARDVEVAALADELLGLNAYMDAGALARLVGEQDAVSGAWLRVDPVRADSLYAALKRLPAVAGVGVREAAAESFRRTIAESFRISLLVTIVFAVVIAAGMVYNGARIALSERGRELASLRVLGFSRREVTAMLLGEQGLLTLLAIPAGYAVGMGFCMLLVSRFATELFRIPLVLRGETYLFALVVVAGAALLSAMAVGMRIARLDLVAVLKTRE
jgi:putative ABC transport system permease protein